MVESRPVSICPSCLVEWVPGMAPACPEADHVGSHRTFDLHVHRCEVVLLDGTSVTPVSFYVGDPYGRDQAPDYGVYLDPRWQPPWPSGRLDWPDLGLPTDRAAVRRALEEVLRRARAGQRVEVGCWGGHGRTGTALAGLAVLSGCPAADAVSWVRANYCTRAVETDEQASFVESLGAWGFV